MRNKYRTRVQQTRVLYLLNTQAQQTRVPLIKCSLFSNDHFGNLYPTLTSKNYYGGVLVTIYVNFLFKYFINLTENFKTYD